VRTGRSAGYVLGSVVPSTRGHVNSAPMGFTASADASPLFVSHSVGFVVGVDSANTDLPASWLTIDGGVRWTALHPKIS
jgi:hypothetical protein